MELLTEVHSDQEALIADLVEQLSTCQVRCAELEAMLADICGPPLAAQGGPAGYPTRAAQLQAAESRVAELARELIHAKVTSATQKTCVLCFHQQR